MSQSLGEKLRLAREERGISLTEVAEQTRISPHYLQAIEIDDYRTLPGGIFNKGFIKSYAKYVGVNENEALADYSRIINADNPDAEEAGPKIYKPEVLTDDRNSGSMVPTIITAVVVLGLLTAGILYGLNYLNKPADPTTSTPSPATNPSGTNSNSAAPTDPSTPTMANLTVEVKATTQPVRLQATVDGAKSDDVIAAGSSKTFTPKEGITLNYNRWNAPVLLLSINGKSIALPGEPLTDPKAQRIEFAINKDNLAQIWTDGKISGAVPSINVNANSNNATLGTAAVIGSTTRPTPVTKPSPAANTTSATPVKPPANTAPAGTPKPPTPTANRPN